MADKTYKLTFKLSNGELKEVQFTVPEGEPGDTPYIGDNGNWYIGETDTGVKASGKDGLTPYIGLNGNWYIGDDDTGVKAEGNDGITPHIGSNGNWFIGDTDTGTKAAGKDGEDGEDGYTPQKGVDYFDGEDGQRGTGLLPITTSPSTYTTAVNGLTPAYRIALSKVKSEASVSEVYAGDTLRHSYYHYPVIYVDSSYVYCRTRVSIRGATGGTGAAGANGKSAYQYAQDGGYTGTEEEFAQKLAQETSGSGIHIGTDAPTDENVNVWIDTDEEAEPVNPGGGSVPAAQSDWDATEGQPGHVLNRTHYKGYETIFPETEIALSEDGMFEGEYESVRYPMDDCVYRITWNGVAYKCQPLFEDGMLLLGDIYEDGSYPFYIEWVNMEADGVFGVHMVVFSNDLVEKVTVGIEKEVYVKIPVEYLPETVKTYTVKVPEGEIDLETSHWELSESGDKAAETLYHGGRVFIELYTANGFIRTEITSCTFAAVPDEGWSILIGECVYVKSVRTVAFANGTWMPPTT